MEFKLDGKDFVQLNQLMKILRMVGSGGEAKIRITNGELEVNGEVEKQIRKKLKAGDVVKHRGEQIEIIS